LNPFVADLLDICFRDDPPGTGGAAVEGQEVGPRLLQPNRLRKNLADVVIA
jgi:hypothetical protein